MKLVLASSIICLPIVSAHADSAVIETVANMYLYNDICSLTEAESANTKIIAGVMLKQGRATSADFKRDMTIAVSKTEALEKSLLADNTKRALFCKVMRETATSVDKYMMDAVQ
ncbi:hypothetical protein [Mesorhizobium sp. ESP7-2]|uniref:hypothetical protein n=1 Tax=Mesorhizobium sp. ESP7-2 TaxID=2876622 RepID=UPI001CCD394E|nr:hypothetical protein [Mesorhizobium sp. ESP7-2]